MFVNQNYPSEHMKKNTLKWHFYILYFYIQAEFEFNKIIINHVSLIYYYVQWNDIRLYYLNLIQCSLM